MATVTLSRRKDRNCDLNIILVDPMVTKVHTFIMGRIQTFDEDIVIHKAQQLFWEKGYKGTSLKDILDETGLHKGSLYRVFESKENLFLLALQQYASTSRAQFIKNQQPKKYLTEFFEKLVTEGGECTKGCFIMNTCVELGSDKGLLSKVANSLFTEVTKNFETALTMLNEKENLGLDIEELTSRFVGAAFSIREMSKFTKDEKSFKAIANGVLKEIQITI